jgi:N-acetylneuraminic acid mutarotase
MKARFNWSLVLVLAGWLPAVSVHGQSGTWQARASMSTARSGQMAVVHENQIYVLGGRNASGQVLSTVERYDPTTNTWGSFPSLRKGRENGAAVVYQGQLMVLGGHTDEDETTHDVEVFDSGENRWESFGGLNEAREGLAAIVLSSELYALGGSNENEQILTSVEQYEEGDGEWDVSDWELDVPRASFGVVVLDDIAYVIGGFNAFGPVDLVQSYTDAQGTIEKASLGMARGGLSAATVQGGVLAMGGRKANNQVVSTVDRYDPSLDVWEPQMSMSTPRESFAAVTVGNAVYVFGGRDNTGATLATVEMFTATTVSPPATPALTAPANGVTEIREGVSLAWSAPGASTVDVQVSTSSNFTALVVDAPGLNGASLVLNDLDALTTYYWRVRARNSAGVSDWSPPFAFTTAEGVGIENTVPARFFTLKANYPNPFRGETRIPFEIGVDGVDPIRLEVHDVRGRLVAVVSEGYFAPGAHEATWDGLDNAGQPITSGVYIYTLRQGGRQSNGTLILLR